MSLHYLNDSEECPQVTLGIARTLIPIDHALATLSSFVCVATILLVLFLRIHNSYTNRLTIYLSIASLLCSVLSNLQILPVETRGQSNGTVSLKKGWNGTCEALGCFRQYAAVCVSSVVVWICLYVFVLAVCNRKLQNRIFEVTGLLVSFVVIPVLFSWEPFLYHQYGLTGIWCWIKESCAGTKLGAFNQIVSLTQSILFSVIGLLLITNVVIIFCRRSASVTDRLLQHHRRAIKHVLPLSVYPTLVCLATITDVSRSLYVLATAKEASVSSNIYLGFVASSFYQLSMIALPLPVLLQLCGSYKKKRVQTRDAPSMQTYTNTVPLPSETSRTCYIVPQISCGSDEVDPLIIKQSI